VPWEGRVIHIELKKNNSNFVTQSNFMETIIKIHPAELNNTLLNKIRKFIGSKENIDITISVKEFDPAYADALDTSIEQAETGDVISLTMEEFVAYTPKPKQ
jgi:hypothetical protein